MISLSIADTTQFGIMRGIVSDYEKAFDLVTKAGYTAKLTDVLAVSICDEPGKLAQILRLLADHRIGIDYLYSSVKNQGHDAMIVFRVEDTRQAIQLLKDNNIKLLSQEEVKSL